MNNIINKFLQFKKSNQQVYNINLIIKWVHNKNRKI